MTLYANSIYYINNYNGVVMQYSEARDYLLIATRFISDFIDNTEESDLVKTCTCKIADIFYCYCKEHNIKTTQKKDLDIMLKDPQLFIKLRNVMFLCLKKEYNIKIKTEQMTLFLFFKKEL